MQRLDRQTRAPWSRLVLALAAAAVLSVGACSDEDSGDATPAPTTEQAGSTIHGPLCDALPQGDDPGGPIAIAGDPADVAITWIPVITVFEAGIRAAGLTADLRAAEEVTILAPTDEAFTSKFSQDTLDELLLSRHDDLRALLDAHIVDGSFTVADMVEAGSVTTRAGETIAVTAADSLARLGDGAVTVCADYQVANATIHVIDGVLASVPGGTSPTDPGGDSPG